jgi:putative DNA primase/helicase
MANGNAYVWEISPDSADYPAAPDGLLDLVFRRGRFAPPSGGKARAQTEVRTVTNDAALRRYCEVALEKAADRIRSLVPGQRNQGINDTALSIGHLVGAGGLTKQHAFEVLREACHAVGVNDGDRALTAGGTLERGLDDGAKAPADLSHIGQQARGEAPVIPTDPRDDREAGYGALAPSDDGPATQDEPHDPDAEGLDSGKYPFRCLGYNRDTYYYFSTSKQQITPLKPPQHTTLTLLQLGDLNYWSEFMQVRGKLSEENWKQIANALMQGCHRAGVFSETRVRGRGAWVDGDTAIVHTGDEVRINGESVSLTEVPGRYIYEAAEPWEFDFGDPASNEDAKHLPDIAKRLTWQDPISAALLAGWCVIAPVCGALRWRPHIWITGPSKAGKSTVVKEIVGRIVGPAAIEVEGTTTEAAIRHQMGSDALPIILDEAESEDAQAVMRMQGMLALARVSSSGGAVTKGSQSGKAVRYVVRSCFLFSSINTALKHHADESRVTRLVLERNKDDDALDHYQSIVRDIDQHFTRDYAGAMFSRTVQNLPTLLHNIDVFKSAAAILFNDRRAADQIGPMLAGYYLCHSASKVTVEAAEKFLRKHDWSEHASLESETDEMRLFAHLMTRRVRVNYGGGHREFSIGQAIRNSMENDDLGRACDEVLGPLGIRVDFDTFTISNSAPEIARMLRDTPWASDWRRPLGMIEGAAKTEKTVYFAPGLAQRGTVLPLELLRK